MRDGRTYPLVALVILDGWGIAPPGPGNAVELAETPVFDRLWRDYPHAHLAASGEAVGLPDGTDGQLRGRAPDDRLGPHPRPGSHAREPGDRDRASSSRTTRCVGGLRARRETSTCSGSSRTAASTRTSTISRRCSTFAPEQDAGSTRSPTGATSSPHSAVHDLAELPVDRIATVAGRYYAMDRDNRWDRTERALRRDRGRRRRARGRSVAAVQASYDRGVTDEFIEPVVIDGRPRLDPERDAAIFFNFRPDRARQLCEKLGELGVDLTTMTRYRDDFDFPVAFPEHDRRRTCSRRCSPPTASASSTRPRPRSTRTSRTSSTAAARSRSPGEDRILVASPRDVPSYDHKPEMSAPEVAERVVRGDRARTATASCVVNFANPDMVGHTGVIPAVVQAVETTDECLGRVVDAVERAGGVCTRHRRPRQRRDPAAGGRRQPAHRPHDEPGAGDPDGGRGRFARRASSPTWRRRSSRSSASSMPH